jgi:hypothetical protein
VNDFRSRALEFAASSHLAFPPEELSELGLLIAESAK